MTRGCIICGAPATTSRCPLHRTRARLPGWEWRRLRDRVLERDDHRCRICRRRPAVTVDHIVRVADGGTDREANLRSVCASCHAARHA